jgi:hypothetical protein
MSKDRAKEVYYIGDHQRQDADMHAPILDAGDNEAAREVSRTVMRRLGFSARAHRKAAPGRLSDPVANPVNSDVSCRRPGIGPVGPDEKICTQRRAERRWLDRCASARLG